MENNTFNDPTQIFTESIVQMKYGGGLEELLEAFNNATDDAKEVFIKLLCEVEGGKEIILKYLK